MKNASDQIEFRIRGMDCAEEVATLKRALGRIVGGAEFLSFDILAGKLIVANSEAPIAPDDVIRAVAATGMRAEIWRGTDADLAQTTWWERQGHSMQTVLSGLFGASGFVYHAIEAGAVRKALSSSGTAIDGRIPTIAIVFYCAGIVCGLWFAFPKACRAILRTRPDMNLLMTIAVVGAAVIGEWFEAATVAFLFSVSLLLESWSVKRARRAIAALVDLAPTTARVRDANGVTRQVPPSSVAVGTRFVVLPGERIPLDGSVVSGAGFVDESSITGESVPAAKGVGDGVFAATINGDSLLEIESTKPADDSMAANIVRLVAEAQSRRAPVERWVERFASNYTPVVLVLAAGILVLPPLLFGGDWHDWLYRALVLLVIACPCALVISTPVTIVAAVASAARRGVLVKGGVFIEAPARVKAVAIDKTGTLTRGEPEVVDIVPLSGHTERELLERAAAMEASANHPLARAIVLAAEKRGIGVAPAETLEAIAGRGAAAEINGKRYWIGSHRLLEERGQETPEVHVQLESMSAAGRTVVVVGHDQHVCGLITLADQIRNEAADAIRALRTAGVEEIVMLTGDNAGTANAVAQQTGIDGIRAELLPEEKLRVVASLVEKHGSVAMIGDGVNDAPALARASIGIAMGAAGSDAAIETADIALMSDDLSLLPWLIRHSRRTLGVVRQNIVFAIAVKLAFVALTLDGIASLWAAIAADMGASLLVIFNGLRLLVRKR